jgi:hypothetical protein
MLTLPPDQSAIIKPLLLKRQLRQIVPMFLKSSNFVWSNILYLVDFQADKAMHESYAAKDKEKSFDSNFATGTTGLCRLFDDSK